MRARRIVRIAPILVAATFGGCAPEALTNETYTLSLGDSQVDLVVHRSGEEGHRYVVLHDDENTAVETGLEIVRSHGGVLFELRHGGERNVQFRQEGSLFRFDPNRIFTPFGAARSLGRWTESDVDPSVTAAVRAFADSLFTLLTDAYDGMIVAIHNNTDEGYSVLSYQSGGELAAEARLVYVAPDEDVDDFVLATVEDLYSRARNAGLHAVLQRMPPETDDGSLSVYAARAGIPYINVEAEHGHYEQQLKMLELMIE